MPDKKISELDAITGSATAADDFFIVVDSSGASTNKISRAELNNAIEQDVLENISITNLTSDLNTNGNDINFGDNDKAIFGAGNDLSIYHDGSGSFVDEQGTGGLILRGTNLFLRSSTNENYLGAVADGAVDLYYDNSPKLSTTASGINVQGSVTADGLTVDGNVEMTGNPVISNSSPEITFETTGPSHANWQIAAQENLSNAFEIASGQQDADASDDTWTKRFTVLNNGDISFYDSTGVTQGFFWDADQQRLGLGTISPISILETYNTSYAAMTSTTTTGYSGFRARSTSGNFYYFIDDSTGSAFSTGAYSRVLWSDGAYPMVFGTNATERMRITSGGSVQFKPDGVTADMTLDASGNLLVGKTSTASNVVGAFILNNGLIRADVDGGVVNVMNRKTNDGDIAVFQKDGTTVGSIGAKSGDIYIGTGDTGLRFNDGDNAVYAADTTTGSASDGNISLGVSSARFKDLYLSGGVYLGGTGAANKLDDYEEGTWTCTPSDSSGNNSSTTATGAYTKIGDVVNVRLNTIQNISTSGLTGSDTLRLNGLPFSVSGNTAGSSSANRIAYASGRTSMTVRAKNGTSYLELIQDGNDANVALATVSNVVSGTSDIAMISITYKTNE